MCKLPVRFIQVQPRCPFTDGYVPEHAQRTSADALHVHSICPMPDIGRCTGQELDDCSCCHLLVTDSQRLQASLKGPLVLMEGLDQY